MDVNLFLDDVPDKFLCTYCSKVVIDPIQHIPCGGYICLECLEFIPDPQKCPKCDDFIADNTDDMNETDLMEYIQLRFECVNDCESVLTFENYGFHTFLCCAPSKPTKCQYCHQDVYDEELFDHQYTYCKMKPMSCTVKGCTIQFPKNQQMKHYEEYQKHHIALFQSQLQQQIETYCKANPNERLPRKASLCCSKDNKDANMSNVEETLIEWEISLSNDFDIRAMAVCDETYRLFAAGAQVNVWNTATCEYITTLNGNLMDFDILWLHVCKTTLKLYGIDERRNITIWDTTSYQCLKQLDSQYFSSAFGGKLFAHTPFIFLPLTNQLIIQTKRRNRGLLEVWDWSEEVDENGYTKCRYSDYSTNCKPLLEDLTWTKVQSTLTTQQSTNSDSTNATATDSSDLMASSVAFDIDNNILYCAIHQKGILVWDFANNVLIDVMDAKEGDIISIGTQSITIPVSDNDTSRMFKLKGTKETKSGDNDVVQSSSESEDINLMKNNENENDEGEEQQQPPEQEEEEEEQEACYQLIVVPNDFRLYACCTSTVKIFDTKTRKLIQIIDTGMEVISGITVSSNTQRLYASGENGGEVQGWDTKTFMKVGCYEGYASGRVDVLITSPDTFRLYSVHEDNRTEIEVWDTV